jgi:hypothetical protein
MLDEKRLSGEYAFQMRTGRRQTAVINTGCNTMHSLAVDPIVIG